MRRSTVLAPLVAVGLLAVAGACSEETASDQVCDARSDLGEGVEETADDLAAGNLGDARDSLDDVQEDYDELADAMDDLVGEQGEELAPQFEDLEQEIEDLGNAESADELGSQVDEALSRAESILGQIGDELDCG
jgi:hypothetical protein